jgi:poly(A) polymerase
MKEQSPVINLDALTPLEPIRRCLADAGLRAYLVGGALRDRLLDRDSRDIDIAVTGDGIRAAAEVARALGGTPVTLDTEHGIGRVVLSGERGDWQLDFTSLTGSIEADLAARDFTLNALALELTGGDAVLLDPLGGLGDIARQEIRATGPDVFRDDPLRRLRAVRLSVELGFSIQPQTEEWLAGDGASLEGVAGERIRDELLKIIRQPAPADFWRYLDRLGLVSAIFPELEAGKGVGQPEEHHWDVYEHALETAQAAAAILRQGVWRYADDALMAPLVWQEKLARHFATPVGRQSDHRMILILAALLHDIAKPEKRAVAENGRIRFLEHDKAGAEMAEAVMRRLRFSGRERRAVSLLVRYHMRPTQLSPSGLPTARAIYRYFRDTGEFGIDVLFLSLADHAAARGPGRIPEEWQRHCATVAHLVRTRYEESRRVDPPRLINGADLMRFLKLPPGPEIGQLLEQVREAQASGKLDTAEQALDYAAALRRGGADATGD